MSGMSAGLVDAGALMLPGLRIKADDEEGIRASYAQRAGQQARKGGREGNDARYHYW